MYYAENGEYPTVGGFASSNSGAWGTIETAMGTTLPRDPVNATGQATDGTTLTYSYYSGPENINCNQQFYMLIYNKENSNGLNDGIKRCDGNIFTYGNAFVVGMTPVQ